MATKFHYLFCAVFQPKSNLFWEQVDVNVFYTGRPFVRSELILSRLSTNRVLRET